ncbi:MAG: dihydroneopterin aldolase [Actinobacteria bacterium]|nr:MAG: dihydroneopterin aldolase [Actinomycetota bacterium]
MASEGERTLLFRARVEALEVHVRCGVSEEERALPQTLLIDLEYAYEAAGKDDIAGVVDYGLLLVEVASRLEREEFKLLETAARMVGGHVLSTFPAVREVSVSVTKPRVPVMRSLSGVSVSVTFRR